MLALNPCWNRCALLGVLLSDKDEASDGMLPDRVNAIVSLFIGWVEKY